MTNHDTTDDAILTYFCAGRDTAQIASDLGLTEATVANRLQRIPIERRRAARRTLAAVERRVGITSVRMDRLDHNRSPLARRAVRLATAT